jgi:hypothetical protein
MKDILRFLCRMLLAAMPVAIILKYTLPFQIALMASVPTGLILGYRIAGISEDVVRS